MHKVSVALSESEYAAFERAARLRERSASELLHQAITAFAIGKLEAKPRLMDLPTLAGLRPLTELPSRSEVYDEIFGSDRGEVR